MAKAKVTRIKANDSKENVVKSDEPEITRKKVVVKDKKDLKAKKEHDKMQKRAEKATLKAEKKKAAKKTFVLFRPFVAIGHYLKESWQELRQVRWPNRKATWKLLIAILIYTALFVAIIMLLDAFFTFIFNLILG